jgi:hypothetical protein
MPDLKLGASFTSGNHLYFGQAGHGLILVSTGDIIDFNSHDPHSDIIETNLGS